MSEPFPYPVINALPELSEDLRAKLLPEEVQMVTELQAIVTEVNRIYGRTGTKPVPSLRMGGFHLRLVRNRPTEGLLLEFTFEASAATRYLDDPENDPKSPTYWAREAKEVHRETPS